MLEGGKVPSVSLSDSEQLSSDDDDETPLRPFALTRVERICRRFSRRPVALASGLSDEVDVAVVHVEDVSSAVALRSLAPDRLLRETSFILVVLLLSPQSSLGRL